MKDTGLSEGQIVDKLSQSYSWDADSKTLKVEQPYALQNYYAAGSMYSTPNDLLKFSNSLYGGKLMKPDTLKLLLKPNLADYACGLWVYDYNINGVSLRLEERQGSIWDTTNRLLYLLDKDVTIIILSNVGSGDMDKMQLQVLSKYVPGAVLPSFDATAQPNNLITTDGSPSNITIALTCLGSKTAGNTVDIEVKDADGKQVDQFVQSDVVMNDGETKTIPYSWTPKSPGTYTVSVGVFQSNWRQNYLWLDKIATITVR